MVKVEVVFVSNDQLIMHYHMELKDGATVKEALQASGLYLSHPETKELPVGIFAKRVSLDNIIRDGDRIEIYRSLKIDPKENRRQRAKFKNKID